MIRELLFRGVTKEGKWVYGDLIHTCGGFAIYDRTVRIETTVPDESLGKDVVFQFYKDELLPIYTASVGRFTGLLDKNDAKIFEGDILKEEFEYAKGDAINYHGYVAWNSVTAQFELLGIDNVGVLSFYFLCNKLKRKYSVVGNIYENTELLKKSKVMETKQVKWLSRKEYFKRMTLIGKISYCMGVVRTSQQYTLGKYQLVTVARMWHPINMLRIIFAFVVLLLAKTIIAIMESCMDAYEYCRTDTVKVEKELEYEQENK